MVHPDSHRISRVPRYSGACLKLSVFRVQGYHLLWLPFPEEFCYTFSFVMAVPQPRTLRKAFGLGCSHFARRYSGNRFCFLFLWLLRCFSSPGCLFLFYEFKKEFYRGCPIRESSDLCLFPAPRSVSPVSAPFIVSECLGLHRKPSFL